MQLNTQSYGSGEPLIILHGLFGSLNNWNSISKRLSAEYRVIAVDQRNHGASPHTRHMDYPSMADDLRDVLDTNRIASAHVLGHSMGGKTAMQFATSYPDRVRKLIVVDIAPRAYPPHHDDLIEAMQALDLAAATSRSDLDRDLARRISDVSVRQFLLTNVVRDDEGRYYWRLDLEAITQAYDALVAAIDPPSPFDGPTFFVRGERSDYIRAEDREQIMAIFPNARIETIAGVGHWVHAEAPAEFIRRVQAFLRE